MNNLLGQKFGKLTVVEKNGSKWKCVCDCGNEVLLSEKDLIEGNVLGCGCKPTNLEDVVVGIRVYSDDEPDFSGLKKYFNDDEPDFSGLKED